MKPALNDTVRVKAFRVPKEAYPDPSESTPYVPFADRMTTVRSKAFKDATTMVRRDAVSKWLTFQIWGVAVLLVAVMFVLFR